MGWDSLCVCVRACLRACELGGGGGGVGGGVGDRGVKYRGISALSLIDPNLRRTTPNFPISQFSTITFFATNYAARP